MSSPELRRGLDNICDKEYKPLYPARSKGTSTGDGRLMRAGAVPGMRLVTSSAGGSETRPAGHCQELAARGADRLSATMKRGTGLSHSREALVRTAVERREASASPKRSARRDSATQAALRLCATAVSTYASFGAPPPFC